jgi:hypothetical protein
MAEKHLWLVYVALAGLSWGTYVPLIFYGGNELGGKGNARLMAILCVGVAYFLIGVLFPLVLFLTGQHEWPTIKATGLVFSGLAGVAGALGAICVIFASQAATKAAVDAGESAGAYRFYIAPLIFGLAPVINTLVSLVWLPRRDEPFHFGIAVPGWKLWVGIVLVGLGAALVLMSKEEAEVHPTTPQQAPKVALLQEGSPSHIPEARP